MKKKIIGTVVFLALAAAFLWKLNDIFSLKQEDGILPMEVFYEQEPGSIDVMFYGSSHTYSDINPAVLWEEAGIPSYDLAGSLQPLWNTYYYMKESLKYQRPKVMVVERAPRLPQPHRLLQRGQRRCVRSGNPRSQQ